MNKIYSTSYKHIPSGNEGIFTSIHENDNEALQSIQCIAEREELELLSISSCHGIVNV